ncbi:putative signal peptide-containing protein [Cryptosporidium canis]|uniref:Signal peptide-containing protein n=1 Tax=Cryptosporidium canis TaxID=195482 RepID=A0A9D5DIW3_9CRYT|nr:putative signal peptide-containing protein [Cryptosporidium canis]
MKKVIFSSRAKLAWLCVLLVLLYLGVDQSLASSPKKSAENKVTQTGEVSESATEEAEPSEADGSTEDSPEVSINLMDPSGDFPAPKIITSDQGTSTEDDHKVKIPKAPKFHGDLEEVSEGAGVISPFDKQTSTDDLETVQFEKVKEEPFIYTMPVDSEKAKLREIKQLQYTVEPEVSFDEYEIGKDVAKDSELYYTYKEKVASEKKILSEVLKVVADAEQYRKSIDTSIKSLILSVNQIKEAIVQHEEQLQNMQKSGSVPNVSIVAQEDELARLRLRYQEAYGQFMSEKRKRDSAIDLVFKAKKQQLNIEERIKRTEEKIKVLESQLDIHEDSSVPTEPLEILKEPEVEIKQKYVQDDLSLAPRQADADLSPSSYDISHGLEAEESTGAPEESSPVPVPEVPAAKPVRSSAEKLSVSEVSPITPRDVSVPMTAETTTLASSSKFQSFDTTKFIKSALSGIIRDEAQLSQSASEVSSRINVINFAMSCIYEVDYTLKQLNLRNGSSYSSSDAIKVCRQAWRESFADMVKFYKTFTPSTLRAIFKSAIQNDQEAVSTLTNYYVEEQFQTIAKHVDVSSSASCRSVVTQLFKSADFQRSLIESICQNYIFYITRYSNMIENQDQLKLFAAKLAVYGAAPYSYDSAPYTSSNDLDQMIAEVDFAALTSSSAFYAQCLKVFSSSYGPESIYGLSNNAVQSVCTSAQAMFNKSLPHGVDVVIFSSKQFPLELIPLLSGATSISFYGQGLSGKTEALFPRDVSVSSPGSLPPQSISDLSPALQLSLQALDEQSKTQKFLMEQQQSISKILENPLSSTDMHKIVDVIKRLNEKQKVVESNIIAASPIQQLQNIMIAIPDSKSAIEATSTDSSVEISIAGVFIERVSSQQNALSSQIAQLESILRSPSISQEDRSVTKEILRDTEQRKSVLASQLEDAISSIPGSISGISDSPSISMSSSISISPSASDKTAFDFSVSELKSLYMEISESNKESMKRMQGINSTPISDPSVKNEYDSLAKKVQKVSSKLEKINKKLQQPNISFKSKDEIDEFKRIMQKLLHASRQLTDRLRTVEKSISQNTQTMNANPSLSLSPILTQSAISQAPLPSSTTKVSSLLVKVQHIQSQIEKLLIDYKERRLQKTERRTLKKLFSDAEQRLVLLYKLVIKIASSHSTAQNSDFSLRYLDQILAVYTTQKVLLKSYLIYSKRPENSADGVKINSMINEMSKKLSHIEKVFAEGYPSKKSPKRESSISEFHSVSPTSPIAEPEFLDKPAPGYQKPQKLVLPAIPYFKRPVIPKPRMDYSHVRRDARGVPITSGPVVGSKVGEKALDYIENALVRQKTPGIYPEGYAVPGSTANKPIRPKPQPKPEVSSPLKPQNRDTFCTRLGYGSITTIGNQIAYRLYLKATKILPRSTISVIDRKTACNISSSIQETKTAKDCARVLYPTLLRLGYSVSQHRTEKVCAAIGIDGKVEGCSSLNSFRTSSPYDFSKLEEDRAFKLYSRIHKLQASGAFPTKISFHLVCHVFESMKASLLKTETFSSFMAFECSSAFEQQVSHDGYSFTASQSSALLKACEESGFPSS